MPWRGPSEPGEYPTLGYAVGEWIEEHLVIPDRDAAGQPLLLTDEMWRFLLAFYRLDGDGTFVHYGAQLRRPQKWGKDPFGGAVALAEALADVVHDGWDAAGEPVGRPRATPLVQCLGVSEEQTDNTFVPIVDMILRGPLASVQGMDAGETRVNLPGGGRIEPVTSAARSRLGARITFATMTETHLWTPSSGGRTLASAVRRNLAGMGGRWMELTNAYDPAEQSVAQTTAEAGAPGVLIDDRPGRHVDLEDVEALRRELARVYGDSAKPAGGWVDLDRIALEAQDPATLEGDARRFFLNQVVAGAQEFVDALRWDAAARTDAPLRPGEQVALGFDGSKSDDATALIASRLSDGRLFHLRTWAKPTGQSAGWRVPGPEVDQAMRDAFAAYRVSVLFADPWKWQDYIDGWTARWPGLVLEFPTNVETRMDKALERFGTAFRSGELTHDGDATLSQHVKNAVLARGSRKRSRHEDDGTGTNYLKLAKKKPGLKIDGAVAAVLAHAARAHAIENGALQTYTGGWMVGV